MVMLNHYCIYLSILSITQECHASILIEVHNRQLIGVPKRTIDMNSHFIIQSHMICVNENVIPYSPHPVSVLHLRYTNVLFSQNLSTTCRRILPYEGHKNLLIYRILAKTSAEYRNLILYSSIDYGEALFPINVSVCAFPSLLFCMSYYYKKKKKKKKIEDERSIECIVVCYKSSIDETDWITYNANIRNLSCGR